jgi:hypothetical protein
MCHSRHHHRRAVARPTEDPVRRDPGLRASDSERESIVSQLREHGVAGRLDVAELEQRVAAAYAARTHGELGELLADLPRRPPARPVDSPRRPGHDWGGFVPIAALLIAIWAVTGAGYFWPAWVIVWWGFALVMKSGPRLLRLR